MSTKIYNAFRMKRSNDLRPFLDKLKSIATDVISKDPNLLRIIHRCTIIDASNALKIYREETNKYNQAKEVLAEAEKGEFSFWTNCWMLHFLKRAKIDTGQHPANVLFNISIWNDRRYYYVKFYVNMGVGTIIYSEILNKCPELEDYHYQDQSDPPEDIPYRSYKNRIKKWDQIMGPRGNYRDMLEFTVFDENDFMDLLEKNYYTGEKDLYKHLAYKFDDKFILAHKQVKTE